LEGGGENCGTAKNLSGSQPVQKYLSPVTRDYEVPSMTTGEQEKALRGVFLIEDHRGGTELPMFGYGKDRVELGLRQSRKKARLKIIGKADDLVSERQFARAMHKMFSSAQSTTSDRCKGMTVIPLGALLRHAGRPKPQMRHRRWPNAGRARETAETSAARRG
jgi:hypothetical protein